MRLIVGKDDEEWTDLVWTWFHQELHDQQRVFIPSGRTAQPFYQRAVQNPSTRLKSLRFIQLDEILTGPQAGSFRQFFEQNMKPYLAQFEWIQNADKGASVAVLGVGMNGHVAFHEPGLPKEFASGCVTLSDQTLKQLQLTQTTWAVTYGAATFMKCEKILVLARGLAKKEVIEGALEQKTLPISWILDHPNVSLITDFALSR